MTLSEAARILAEAGIEDTRAEARLIFSEIGGISLALLVGGDPSCDSEDVASAVHRRAKREPLQYILGEVGFYNERYYVTPDCLIPRPDTECLVSCAVEALPEGALFADLCTGSGCVGISTLCAREDTRCVAVDISGEAARIAVKNAERNRACERFSVIVCDLLKSDPLGDMLFDAVLSNPPYIPRDVYLGLEKEIFFEPEIAFVGGESGGIFYERLIPLALSHLKDGGFIALEIGYDQGDLLRDLGERNGLDCRIISDLGGKDRVAVLRRK